MFDYDLYKSRCKELVVLFKVLGLDIGPGFADEL